MKKFAFTFALMAAMVGSASAASQWGPIRPAKTISAICDGKDYGPMLKTGHLQAAEKDYGPMLKTTGEAGTRNNIVNWY